MIQVEFANRMAREYCRLRGVDITNGMIPKERVGEIKDFVNEQLKIMSQKTRENEVRDKMRISAADIAEAVPSKQIYESPIEEFLILGLRRGGLSAHFEPQFKIGKYRVDFACPKKMLAVECDGHEYHFTEKSQIENDQKRDKYLARKGWRVLHIEGIAIRRNIDFCIQRVREALEAA